MDSGSVGFGFRIEKFIYDCQNFYYLFSEMIFGEFSVWRCWQDRKVIFQNGKHCFHLVNGIVNGDLRAWGFDLDITNYSQWLILNNLGNSRINSIFRKLWWWQDRISFHFYCQYFYHLVNDRINLELRVLNVYSGGVKVKRSCNS